MTTKNYTISELSINTIRTLTIDSVEKAQHGHAGMPMGAAPMAYALWKKHLSINPESPSWFNRDRFVLSAGHGSNLLYNLLHLSGYPITIEDLKQTRQWGSKTPGHPEYGITPGVEATTGPLGQGIPVSVGMAIAEKHLAEIYNKPDYKMIDHYTYTICGDGDLMEGVSYEAISLAGHLQLDKLIVLYDSNDISLDGDLDISFSDHIQKRFEAACWQYLNVEDGNDVEAITKAIEEAKQDKERPTVIEIKTTIGYGSPNLQGTHHAHSDPLGKEEIERTKEVYGWEYEPFHVPKEVYEDFATIKENGKSAEEKWHKMFEIYKTDFPELGEQLNRIVKGELADDWDIDLPTYSSEDTLATRVASGSTLNKLAEKLPELIGGSADLDSSTKTRLTNEEDFKRGQYQGRNLRFGVREFAMGAIANGLALHHLRPFISTFFVFSDYLRPAIRLASLMELPVTYVFTHDSVAVGQDGPTHQPIEHLASFRAMPGLSVIRPADANETKEAWKLAVENTSQPTMLVLGRQGLPTLKNSAELAKDGVRKGAYVVSKSAQEPEGILIAAGSEVNLAIEAQKELEKQGIFVNVVSMPSWDRFEIQSEAYKESVLPKGIRKRVSIEMGSKLGWREYVGDSGIVMSIDSFGASAPGNEVIERYGYTIENVVNTYKCL
ncbi:transketolase [Oceanobacillus oncorhynchi subsp. oncorhynchi]|uniref:transketolase n=1 Tax=Oceanobacillus TaxID=182709 RepID=UPI0030DAA969